MCCWVLCSLHQLLVMLTQPMHAIVGAPPCDLRTLIVYARILVDGALDVLNLCFHACCFYCLMRCNSDTKV